MKDYDELTPGDVLEAGDEYSTRAGMWRTIPDFMEGDVIPVSHNTSWRRRKVIPPNKKKGFFNR